MLLCIQTRVNLHFLSCRGFGEEKQQVCVSGVAGAEHLLPSDIYFSKVEACEPAL